MLALSLPVSAEAQDAAPTAQRAAEVHEQHCSEVAAGQATAAAEAMAAVTPVLAEVSRGYDDTQDPALLFWRGMLNQCLGQEDRAQGDLQAFVDQVGEDDLYAAQVQEARKRLRRLATDTVGSPRDQAPPRAAGGVVAGAVLLGAGGALGGLSGWQNAIGVGAQADYDAGLRPWDDTAAILADGQRASGASKGLLAGAIGCGAAGAVVLGIAAATGSKVSTAAVLLPTPDGGFVVSIGGAW